MQGKGEGCQIDCYWKRVGRGCIIWAMGYPWKKLNKLRVSLLAHWQDHTDKEFARKFMVAQQTVREVRYKLGLVRPIGKRIIKDEGESDEPTAKELAHEEELKRKMFG